MSCLEILSVFGFTGDYRLGLGSEALGESEGVEVSTNGSLEEILEESGYTEIEPVADIFIVFNLMEYYKSIQTQEEKIEEKERKNSNLKSIRHTLSTNSFGVEL